MSARVTTVADMTALLLAEPEATMRGFLARQLRSDGFDVLAFSSTDELPRAAEPDVLVLGDPDALDRCRVPDCPVIVLGRADPEAKVRALERCDDYLTRPFVYEELVGSVSGCEQTAVSGSFGSTIPFLTRPSLIWAAGAGLN